MARYNSFCETWTDNRRTVASKAKGTGSHQNLLQNGGNSSVFVIGSEHRTFQAMAEEAEANSLGSGVTTEIRCLLFLTFLMTGGDK